LLLKITKLGGNSSYVALKLILKLICSELVKFKSIYNPFFLSASKSIGAFIARSSGVSGSPGIAEEANM
jgi:hypothetical protein